MNNERNENNENNDEKILVTVQWYKSNVVRLIFNSRVIWETKEIALNDVLNPDTAFSETTLQLDLLESINYSKILLQGLQVNRLEQINLLVQLRVEQWQMKVILFEQQLKQRIVDMGLAKLLDNINPDDPGSYTLDDGESFDEQRCECNGGCDECSGEYCESLGINDIESDDNTLKLCKGCSGERDSCADCEDADPNDADNLDTDIRRKSDSKKSDNENRICDDNDIFQR
ncbi:hypothetical protein LCGC14_0377870 [marine sediment metagenome]|uniref:Uncharacterized protein n=1 Tax=marine sediment metagenome TaxID=412755 RepID=A0A0F9T904_9ZZZZ